MTANSTVLSVQDLSAYYYTLNGWVRAAESVTFDVEMGQAMGLAGESGCGKTTVAMSLLKILPRGGRIRKGKIIFDGEDLVPLSENEMRKRRWKGISIVFQGAMSAFNPVYKVGDQIAEAIKTHESGVSKADVEERIAKLLETVGIEPSRADNYPHEFSGGMRQRALIAMALAANPKMLIADEPGTALDVIVQAQTLKLLRDLKDRLGLSMIMISHDLSIIAETCEKVAIMYAGRIVEYGDAVSIFKNPMHPYTQGLIKAFPSIKAERVRLTSIPGTPPDLIHPPPACRFNPRCPYVMDICKKIDPQLVEHGEKNHLAACHLY